MPAEETLKLSQKYKTNGDGIEPYIANKSAHESTQSGLADHTSRVSSSERNTNSESNYIYSLTTNGVFGESEANYIIIFDCRDDYDIIIEAKIQNPKNNNLTFFLAIYLNKKHIGGVVSNENGKTLVI